MERQIWLDGVRGVAAALVTFDHFILGEWWQPFRSFWAEPAEDNRRIIQLPPFRLLFAPQGMVAMFMVISAYSISLNLVHIRDYGTNLDFYQKLSSAALRRGFRLFLPVVFITLLSQILFFFGGFDWSFPTNERCDLEPFARPWSHLMCCFTFVLDLLNIRGPLPTGLAGHLWTIPTEFRGSMAVYLLIMALATARQQWRMRIILALVIFMFWCGQAALLCFFCGLAMVESKFSGAEKLPTQNSHNNNHTTTFRSRLASVAQIYAPFVLGTLLLGLPDLWPLPPDYKFQAWIAFPRWDEDGRRTSIWLAVGAAFMTLAIHNSVVLRKAFETRLAQYLGKLSFAMYLVHRPLLYVVRNRMLKMLALLFTGDTYGHLAEDIENPGVLFVVWVVAGMSYTVCVVFLSDWASHWVDYMTVQWARRLEKHIQ